MKNNYKTWPIRWTRFPEEHFTTNWIYINNCLEVTFSELSSGLIPISELELEYPKGRWEPLRQYCDKIQKEDE